MNVIKRSFFVSVLGLLFVLGFSFALAQTTAPVIEKVSSCNNYAGADNAVACVEGVIAKDKQYLVVIGQNFTISSKVSMLGKEYSPDSYSSKFLKIPMPVDADFGTLSSAAIRVKIGEVFSNYVEVPIGTTTTPTPKVSPTPTAPLSGTPTPSGIQPSTPTPTPSIPKIQNDLSSECAKQGLQYDDISGLCLPANPYQANANSLAGQVTLGGLVRRVLNILLTLAGVVAVLMIVLGGYQYVTSQGADDKAKAGRKTVTNAAIGLIAVLLAYMLVTVVTNFITQGTIF